MCVVVLLVGWVLCFIFLCFLFLVVLLFFVWYTVFITLGKDVWKMVGVGILGGVVMVGCMVLAVCLISVLFWIFPLRGCHGVLRDVVDMLCFLVMLVLGMIIVFVFSE